MTPHHFECKKATELNMTLKQKYRMRHLFVGLFGVGWPSTVEALEGR